MASIRDKIKKLLSLASSDNENEARAALLKAKELMAKNKLSEEDFEESKERTLVTLECEDVKWTTDSGEIWMVSLCKILCEQYCCAVAWRTPYRTRTHIAVVTGIGEDAEVAKVTIEYAVGVVRNNIKRLQKKWKTRDPKSIATSYADGFCAGLEIAFELQKDEHPEWGLVVVKPQEVKDYESSLSNRNVRTKETSFVWQANMEGLKDGKAFTTKHAIATN